jgi:hypothetical protein
MSSFPSERRLRTHLAHWREWQYPNSEVLEERRYKADRPPFFYFPSVQTIVNFAVCPVAGVHDMIYGIDDALMDPHVRMGTGKLFHEFVSYLKASLAGRTLPCTLPSILSLYDDFARWKPPEVARSCKASYVRPWADRKLKELMRIGGDTQQYFELRALGTVRLGTVKYPLHGTIDELDVTEKKIIERTIRPGSPPFMKDFQVWLYWKLLCGIPKEERPELWSKENFENYELVVETPWGDYPVDKYNPEFESWAKDAYAWISDLSSSKATYAIKEAFDEARRFCTKEHCWDECRLYHRFCFARSWKFPGARKAMHARIRKFYLSLLYEQMWNHHLFLYQQLKLPQTRLDGWKVFRGRVERQEADTLYIRFETPLGAFLEREEEEEIYGFDVIFGNLRMGLAREARKVGRWEDGLKIKVLIAGRPLPSQINILLPSTSVFKEGPWFLCRNKQRAMRSFERWGLELEEKAKRNVFVQLVESSFGVKKLIGKRGGEK